MRVWLYCHTEHTCHGASGFLSWNIFLAVAIRPSVLCWDLFCVAPRLLGCACKLALNVTALPSQCEYSATRLRHTCRTTAACCVMIGPKGWKSWSERSQSRRESAKQFACPRPPLTLSCQKVSRTLSLSGSQAHRGPSQHGSQGLTASTRASTARIHAFPVLICICSLEFLSCWDSPERAPVPGSRPVDYTMVSLGLHQSTLAASGVPFRSSTAAGGDRTLTSSPLCAHHRTGSTSSRKRECHNLGPSQAAGASVQLQPCSQGYALCCCCGCKSA